MPEQSLFSRIIDKAAEVREIELELFRAYSELEVLIGVKPANSSLPGRREPVTIQPRRGPGSNSVAQRVLRVLESGPRSRRDIVVAIGEDQAPAVNSALKKHASTGRIVNADGAWKLAATDGHAGGKKTKGRAP